MWKQFQPKENSKTQQRKRAEAQPIKYVGCNKCHSIGVTLIKGKDSYYCPTCYQKILKKEK